MLIWPREYVTGNENIVVSSDFSSPTNLLHQSSLCHFYWLLQLLLPIQCEIFFAIVCVVYNLYLAQVVKACLVAQLGFPIKTVFTDRIHRNMFLFYIQPSQYDCFYTESFCALFAGIQKTDMFGIYKVYMNFPRETFTQLSKRNVHPRFIESVPCIF